MTNFSGGRFDTGFRESWLAIGAANWLFWFIPGWHDVRVEVWFEQDAGQHVEVHGLTVSAYLEGLTPDGKSAPQSLTATDLRQIPLGGLTSFLGAAGPARALERSAEAADDAEPVFDPSRLTAAGAFDAAMSMPLVQLDRTVRIKNPGGSKPDEFYRTVADAFGRLALVSASPASDIASANNVPVTTVHRWVKEARRRRFLPPARPS
ncbi:MAG TPA: hypothetical protein VMZ33_06935 [Candidatus Limnocylindrales bacterium]|nr:hypothetical protein [Candidatus Limnocylindrales bacterium]